MPCQCTSKTKNNIPCTRITRDEKKIYWHHHLPLKQEKKRVYKRNNYVAKNN